LLFLCKVWAFIKKYWEAFVALLILMLGIVLGTSGKRTRVLEKDKEALAKQSKDFQEGVTEIIANNKSETETAEIKREERKKAADEATVEKAQELKNDDKKLDKILKDKYNLKKG
jgi:ABC-type transport system involved in cytochrome bd biosynthesis fused ATPase/permease subunit